LSAVTDADRDPAAEDVALVVGASEDGETLGVLRKRGTEVQTALLKKAVEGQPLHGELVRLKPREEPLLFDVETLYAPPAAEAAPPTESVDPSRTGPAKFTTKAYRRGWSRLFSTRKREPSAPS
jgi:hypothetical protein